MQSALVVLVYMLGPPTVESASSAQSPDICSTTRVISTTHSLPHHALLLFSLNHTGCLSPLLRLPAPTPAPRPPTHSPSSPPLSRRATPITCTRTHARCCVPPLGRLPPRRRRTPA
ncbi:hypothetical protein BC628DRAFT_1381989 [Trametes gibbosa]|nr:hypothetical protein BC628DRAFT_1381989 [Trametes gibbosa]